MPSHTHRIHNRFKLPFFVVCFLAGAALAIAGATMGHPEWVFPGAVAALVSVPPIWVILRRRGNPWWMRSPFDPPQADARGPASRSRDEAPAPATRNGRGDRARAIFILAGSLGFVVVGIALVAVGAVKGRSDAVVIGALCVAFFGFGGWIGLAALRGSL